jgi:heat shock protein HtpX
LLKEARVKFITRSLLVLLLLYGLVFAIADAYLVHTQAPVWVVVVFPVIFVGLQYLIAPWLIQVVLAIRWDTDNLLPARNRMFIEKLCAERGLTVPRIGIIESGTPNAFSFGRLRSDARVVVTSGLLEILTPEESNAVLAHEIGHIEHWDFAIMTFAALAPMLLYQFYVVTERINNFRAIAYSAYLCYLVSQFIVLLLNRTREYFADHYAAEVTHMPDDLASALVKIAYGMVRQDSEYRKAREQGSSAEKKHWNREHRLGGALGLMGISNLHSGQSLALAGANPADAAAVMRWDLTNPWARFYELNSTHPLTALRVRQLSHQALQLNQSSRYSMPEDQPIHWGTFPLQLLVWGASFLCVGCLLAIWWFPGAFAYLGIALTPATQPVLLMLAGAMWLLRVAYRYRGKFQDAKIGTLLEDLEVSQMNPRAVRLRGTIRGRGEPGAFWSPDLVLRDETGMIFVMYRQSIPFARFLFGVTEAESYVGQEVVVEGWFRRGLMPYVELSKLTGENHCFHRTVSRWVQCAVAISAILAGWIWLENIGGLRSILHILR